MQSQVLSIYQPVGFSTYQITAALAAMKGEKATHTGVLDPLAEGVIIVLLGSERFKKHEYTNWKKEYIFDVTFGIQTDSYDGLGFVTKTDFACQVDEGSLKRVLKDFKGKYVQKVPLYSAKKVNGKKLFMYPKLNLSLPELPEKEGEIYDMELVSFKKTPLPEIIGEVIKKISKICAGEFRQKETLAAWETFMNNNCQGIVSTTATIRAVLSKGLYVRSLSQDIAGKLGTIGFVTNLVRTKNGEYTKENSLSIEEVFGKDFNIENLVSKFRS